MSFSQALVEKRVEDGVCVRCGQLPWGGDGPKITSVDPTPIGASDVLRKRLHNARFFVGKPLCDECSSKIGRQPGGGHSSDAETKGKTYICFEY